jgi:hypothetical protein
MSGSVSSDVRLNVRSVKQNIDTVVRLRFRDMTCARCLCWVNQPLMGLSYATVLSSFGTTERPRSTYVVLVELKPVFSPYHEVLGPAFGLDISSSSTLLDVEASDDWVF